MIAIFAANDLWNNGAEKGGDDTGGSPADSSQSGVLSEGCLNGWVCLFNLITRVLIHTYTDPSMCNRRRFLVDMSLRHIATVRLFLLWLELQKADGFRPKVGQQSKLDVVSGFGGVRFLGDQLLPFP